MGRTQGVIDAFLSVYIEVLVGIKVFCVQPVAQVNACAAVHTDTYLLLT